MGGSAPHREWPRRRARSDRRNRNRAITSSAIASRKDPTMNVISAPSTTPASCTARTDFDPRTHAGSPDGAIAATLQSPGVHRAPQIPLALSPPTGARSRRLGRWIPSACPREPFSSAAWCGDESSQAPSGCRARGPRCDDLPTLSCPTIARPPATPSRYPAQETFTDIGLSQSPAAAHNGTRDEASPACVG